MLCNVCSFYNVMSITVWKELKKIHTRVFSGIHTEWQEDDQLCQTACSMGCLLFLCWRSVYESSITGKIYIIAPDEILCRPRWLNWMRVRLVIGSCGFYSTQVHHHSFVEIDHEIFSTVILSLPFIQEGQLSGFGKRMCTILVNCLEVSTKTAQ